MNTWGKNITTISPNNYPVKVFEPRAHSLVEFLDLAHKWSAREFVVYGDKRRSYGCFLEATRSAAAYYHDKGVRKGDMVLVLGANSPEWILSFWALTRLGAVVAMGNAWWSKEDILAINELIKPKLLIADAKRQALLEGALDSDPLETLEEHWDAPASAELPEVSVSEEDPALIIFTSGTTGRSKAATFCHRAIIANIQSLYDAKGAMPDTFTEDRPQITSLITNPLFHVGSTLVQMQTLLSGNRMILVEGRNSADKLLELIATERVNHFPTVPTLLSRVINHPDAAVLDLSCVQAFTAGGSVVTPELVESALRVFPNAKAGRGAMYGLTESGGVITVISGETYEQHPKSSGKALALCEIEINEPNDEGIGEIFARTPSALTEYWGQPEVKIVDEDGWIHTGDLGYLSSEGYLFVTGRLKDIIIRGGENISADRVEELINQHEDVEEVAVVGLPHADLGEELAAAIVLKPGANATPAEIGGFMEGKAGYFEIPSKWWIRDEALPVNANSKVLKHEIIAQWPKS